MLYSIQNSYGEVYGVFRMPPTNISPDVWASDLKGKLSDILGFNGIKDSPLVLDSDTGETEDRVVIDIEPVYDIEDRLLRVHQTVARTAAEHTIQLQ